MGSPPSPPSPLDDSSPSWEDLVAALAAEPDCEARFAEGRARRRRYRPLKTIGRGSEGVVKCALSLDTGRRVAMKVCTKPRAPEVFRSVARTPSAEETIAARERMSGELRRKFEALRELEHPNLPRMLEFFETETKVYTVSELCEGDLSAFIATRKSRRLPEPLIRCMLLPLLRALSHLHAHGIVHRDLKPSNILLRSFSDPADLCLADFDGAHVDSPSRVPKPMETLIGTPFYIAPELVRGLPYGAEVDLYSLGVIAYELAAGETPFADSASYASLYGRIAGAEWEFPAGCGSPELRSLVKGLMHPDPARRTPCREALAHPFFAGPAAVQKRPGLGDRMMSGTAVVWRSETGELFPVGRWGEAVQAGS